MGTKRAWTPERDDQLRKLYPLVGPAGAATALGVSVYSVKKRATRLGVTTGTCRPWTPVERAQVVSLYPTHTTKQIGVLLDRSAKAVEQEVKSLRDSGEQFGEKVPVKCPRVSPHLKDRVRDLASAGLTDAAIAREMGGEVPGTGDPRRWVTYVRTALGLPSNKAAILDARRRAVKTQYERLGVSNTGQLRTLAYRKFARENGWPEDLRPRAVQILNVLAEVGPQTRDELARAIGMRVEGLKSRQKLKSNSEGHSYTAGLIRRGLIFRHKRWGTSKPRGHNRLPDLYILTPTAILWRLNHVRTKRDEAASPLDADRSSRADTVSN